MLIESDLAICAGASEGSNSRFVCFQFQGSGRSQSLTRAKRHSLGREGLQLVTKPAFGMKSKFIELSNDEEGFKVKKLILMQTWKKLWK